MKYYVYDWRVCDVVAEFNSIGARNLWLMKKSASERACFELFDF